MKITSEGLKNGAVNVFLALCFGLFACSHLSGFLKFHRASLLLIVIKETLDAVFFFLRRTPEKVSGSFFDWAVAVGATSCVLLLRPAAVACDSADGQIVQCLGLVFQIYGIYSLNRSLGIVPANRGITAAGAYKYVRHPLYSAYIVSTSGYLMNNFTLQNAIIAAASCFLLMLRVFNEERFLSGYGQYRDYMERTKWRLIPLVF